MAPTIQHVALTVSNPERSAAYFTAALSVFEPKSRPALYTSDRGERPRVVAIEHSLSIMLHPAEDVTAAVDRYRAGSLHHLAIEVDTIELVDRIAASAREAGGRVTDGPRQFPEYRFGYYGVFLRDPDDMKWEVFCYPLLKQYPGQGQRQRN
jgi:catechol 2,3-dioxygenase-like lactoylglutathione lyase family enzyme